MIRTNKPGPRLPTLLLLVALLPSATGSMAADGEIKPNFNQRQRADIEAIVKEFLLKNPAVVQEALVAQKNREALLAVQKTKQALQAHRDALLYNPDSPVAGNPKGDVTIVEFFDYRCGYCKKMSPVLEELTAKDPNVRVVYKDFPILGPDSLYGARAALAARKQNKYDEFHRRLMLSSTIDEAAVKHIAGELGLDVRRLLDDMEDESVKKIIHDVYGLANSLNLSGTPAFVTGDEMLPGATDLAGLMARVSSERAKQKLQAKK